MVAVGRAAVGLKAEKGKADEAVWGGAERCSSVALPPPYELMQRMALCVCVCVRLAHNARRNAPEIEKRTRGYTGPTHAVLRGGAGHM